VRPVRGAALAGVVDVVVLVALCLAQGWLVRPDALPDSTGPRKPASMMSQSTSSAASDAADHVWFDSAHPHLS
jgi:hypothetical protein